MYVYKIVTAIIYYCYLFKIKVSSCSCMYCLVISKIYVYCHATMGSPAHFVPGLQSLISLLLAHLLSLGILQDVKFHNVWAISTWSGCGGGVTGTP